MLKNKSKHSGERQYGTSLEEIKPNHVQRYQKVAIELTEHSIVLDVGCGTGYGSALMAKHAKSVVGIDCSRSAVIHARKNWGRQSTNCTIKFHRDDIHSLVTVRNCERFDVITCFEVLEHLVSPVLALAHFREVIAENGCVFLSVPDAERVLHDLRVYPYHVAHYTFEQIESMAAQANFTAENIGPYRKDAKTLVVKLIPKSKNGYAFPDMLQQDLSLAYTNQLSKLGNFIEESQDDHLVSPN